MFAPSGIAVPRRLVETRSQRRTAGHVLVAALLVLGVAASNAASGNPDLGTRYYAHNTRGDTVYVSNQTGARIAHIDYTPYGSLDPASSSGSGESRLTFESNELDSTTGLHYFHARYYDAREGRFLGADPEEQSASPYVYASSAPAEHVDPDGRRWGRVISAALLGATPGALGGGFMGWAVGQEFGGSLNPIQAAFIGAVVGALPGALLGAGARVNFVCSGTRVYRSRETRFELSSNPPRFSGSIEMKDWTEPDSGSFNSVHRNISWAEPAYSTVTAPVTQRGDGSPQSLLLHGPAGVAIFDATERTRTRISALVVANLARKKKEQLFKLNYLIRQQEANKEREKFLNDLIKDRNGAQAKFNRDILGSTPQDLLNDLQQHLLDCTCAVASRRDLLHN